MSSLIFLGFSVILFIISYGIMFTIAPMILGSVYSVVETNMTEGSMTQEWIDVYNNCLLNTYDGSEEKENGALRCRPNT